MDNTQGILQTLQVNIHADLETLGKTFEILLSHPDNMLKTTLLNRLQPTILNATFALNNLIELLGELIDDIDYYGDIESALTYKKSGEKDDSLG
mgnify:CR=1 FL=1